MLHFLKENYGRALLASDGATGWVKNFYFDEKNWVIRYVVADTGAWIKEDRVVLLSPHAFSPWGKCGEGLRVNLNRKQIENSPSPNPHRPLSRRFEECYHRHHGWPAYWQGGKTWGPVDLPSAKTSLTPGTPPPFARDQQVDARMGNTATLESYYVQARDGLIGFVSGLMFDDANWRIRAIIVTTGTWPAAAEILISPGRVDRISYEESKLFVPLTKAELLLAAEDDRASMRAANLGAETSAG